MPVVDLDLLQDFESGLDPQHPERSRIPARVLGYGEISTVFAIQAEGMAGLAFKRLPLFHSAQEVTRYEAAHAQYVQLLVDPIGLRLPPHQHAVVQGPSGQPVFYIVQRRMPAPSIGHHLLQTLPRQSVCDLIRRALEEMHKVWRYNQAQARRQVAIDGQISNWSVEGLSPDGAEVGPIRLWYLDTSTPLFRVEGVEQLDTELFLRSAPSFLVWILRWLFLQDVVDRYYDPHLVAVDLVANFYKEQRPDLIPEIIDVVREFFAAEAADLGVAAITGPEVRAYYREDALIWRLYLGMRRVDRFLRRRILRRPYPYILPGKIKR
jgi:hypothetical protein